MRLTATLTGAEQVRDTFARIARAPRLALDATAVQVEEYIDTQVAPHNKTHALERSLYKRRIPGGWEIGHDSRVAPYARFVHDGTKPHAIFPRRRKALRWATANVAAFAVGSANGAKYPGKANAALFGFRFSKKGIHHPGTKPDRWIERAAREAPRLFAQQLAARIEQKG